MTTVTAERRLRRCLTATAVAAAVVATAAGCGTGHHDNPAAQPRLAAPVAAAATVGATTTASPTTAASASAGGESAGTAAPTTGTAPARQTGPQRSVPAPVPPAALPGAQAAAWQPAGTLTQMQLSATRTVGIGECAQLADVASWHEQGYASAQNNPAQEDIFTFADTTAAKAAYQAVVTGISDCRQTLRALQQANGVPTDAQVKTTATTTAGQAWSRTWTGVAGASAAGPQINHYYLVRSGSTVILAEVTEFGHPAQPYDTAGDSAVLTMLTAHAS